MGGWIMGRAPVSGSGSCKWLGMHTIRLIGLGVHHAGRLALVHSPYRNAILHPRFIID
jgi:hypothetical protein